MKGNNLKKQYSLPKIPRPPKIPNLNKSLIDKLGRNNDKFQQFEVYRFNIGNVVLKNYLKKFEKNRQLKQIHCFNSFAIYENQKFTYIFKIKDELYTLVKKYSNEPPKIRYK